MHVGRSYTIFYEIHEEEKVIEILSILTIEEAHRLYGRLRSSKINGMNALHQAPAEVMIIKDAAKNLSR